MFENPMVTEETRAALRRWGFPIDGGEDAGLRAVEAIKRADAELDILFPEQRTRLLEIVQRQERTGASSDKDGPFIFGLMMQAMFAANVDAERGGAA